MKTFGKIILFGLLASACLYSCKSAKNRAGTSGENKENNQSDNTDSYAKGKTEGVEGRVTWIAGNQMPQLAESNAQAAKNERGIPVQRTIRIHQLTHINQASLGDYLFGDIETPLVAEIETDEKGYFKTELPPGRYSVFTVEETGYFANVFDLDSYINPLTVEKGKWTNMRIKVDYKAAY
ncbi:hypothetical protein SAMN04488057_105277 [Cyclobacterium lianum]|uniref:Carboxypeptidase regulatory-like domain-containing protein n=1 Tax=Cyclobacterium lianum TaxID=388280 RepID=A0A1M7NF82_9BACT|nr:carboxypeptidase-like regulatory domain-containing protein [Cyclobacterium lianum]SHN02373.1 hypothetical protein SAMN04488057_105277 [Cyclobacterium lianum]